MKIYITVKVCICVDTCDLSNCYTLNNIHWMERKDTWCYVLICDLSYCYTLNHIYWMERTDTRCYVLTHVWPVILLYTKQHPLNGEKRYTMLCVDKCDLSYCYTLNNIHWMERKDTRRYVLICDLSYCYTLNHIYWMERKDTRCYVLICVTCHIVIH